MTTLWLTAAALAAVFFVVAWRPATLRDLLTRTAAVFVAPAAELASRLATLRGALGRAVRHLALHDGSEPTGWRVVGHHLGGILFTLVCALGGVAEWGLGALIFAAFFDTALYLPSWMPSPEGLSAAGLVIAPAIFSAVIFDLVGATHLSNWGGRGSAVKWGAGAVCGLGLLLVLAILALGGWARGNAAFESSEPPVVTEASVPATEFGWPQPVVSEIEPAEGHSPGGWSMATRAGLVTAGTSLVLALSLGFAALGLPALGQLLFLIPTGAVWVLVSGLILALGMWNLLLNAVAGALLAAVTWVSSLVRRDGEAWFAPDPALAEAVATAASRLERERRPATPQAEEPAPAPLPAGVRADGDARDDDPNWTPL